MNTQPGEVYEPNRCKKPGEHRIPSQAQEKWILKIQEIRYSPKVLFG